MRLRKLSTISAAAVFACGLALTNAAAAQADELPEPNKECGNKFTFTRIVNEVQVRGGSLQDAFAPRANVYVSDDWHVRYGPYPARATGTAFNMDTERPDQQNFVLTVINEDTEEILCQSSYFI